MSLRQRLLTPFLLLASVGLVGGYAWSANLPAGKAPAEPGATAQSAPRPTPFDLIPGDALLAWQGQPLSQVAPDEKPAALDVGIRMLTKLLGSNMDANARMTLSLFEGLGQVIRHHFAIALLHVDTTPTPSGNVKGDDFKIAIIVDVEGNPANMLRLIKRAVDELSDESTASLEGKKAAGHSYAEFYDKRLPKWCRVAWGQIDQYFVVTFGRDVWPEIARVSRDPSLALSGDEWLAPQRRTLKHTPLIEIVLDSEQTRALLDPSTDGKATAFFKSWEAGKMQRAFWALGFVERAVYCEAFFQMPRGTRQRLYADPDEDDPKLLATIPETARYAIFRVAMREFLPQLFGSYYATRKESEQREAMQLWARIQKEHGFNAERDVLANLGTRVVSHNYPPHPLNLPMMVTTLAEIDRDAEDVRDTIETMCTAWRDGMQELADRDGYENPVVRDPAGFWYLQLGPISGIAWTVTDQFIITSWSPAALQMYLDRKGDAVGWDP